MIEYRDRAKARTPVPTIVTPVESTAAPAYTHLARKYGLADMRLGASRDIEAQTLEQEYRSYVTAPLSVEGTDMLRFWEVCNLLFSRYYCTDTQISHTIVQRVDATNIFRNFS
jgi:hypothetical protein